MASQQPTAPSSTLKRTSPAVSPEKNPSLPSSAIDDDDSDEGIPLSAQQWRRAEANARRRHLQLEEQKRQCESAKRWKKIGSRRNEEALWKKFLASKPYEEVVWTEEAGDASVAAEAGRVSAAGEVGNAAKEAEAVFAARPRKQKSCLLPGKLEMCLLLWKRAMLLLPGKQATLLIQVQRHGCEEICGDEMRNEVLEE